MSMHTCPKCGKKGFGWHVDEEVSPLTQWFCGYCKYAAEEDEKKETACPACGHEKCYSWMKDSERTYWYCFRCGRRININQ